MHNVPRPRNAFIFFRSHFNKNPAAFAQNGSSSTYADQNSVSCAAATVWNKFDADKRAPFLAMAREEKERYEREYPGYRYGSNGGVKKARRNSTRPRRRSRSSISVSVSVSVSESESETSSEETTSPASSPSATPPPRTPSPGPEPLPLPLPPVTEEVDAHSDYVMGAEFTFWSPIDWDAEYQYSQSRSSDAHVKEEWDTYVDPVFPSFAPFPERDSKAAVSGLSFFNEPEVIDIKVKVEEDA